MWSVFYRIEDIENLLVSVYTCLSLVFLSLGFWIRLHLFGHTVKTFYFYCLFRNFSVSIFHLSLSVSKLRLDSSMWISIKRVFMCRKTRVYRLQLSNQSCIIQSLMHTRSLFRTPNHMRNIRFRRLVRNWWLSIYRRHSCIQKISWQVIS